MYTQRRETFIILLIIIFMLIIGFVIVWFSSYGSITIVTNDANNTIYARSDNNGVQNQIEVKQNGKQATLRVAPGTYVITAENAEQSTTQVVKIGIAENKNVSLIVSDNAYNATVEPVASYGAGNTIATESSLKFIDRNAADRPLLGVAQNGDISSLDPNTNYTSVGWADPSFGVGFGINKSNKYILTTIRDDIVTPIKVPFTVALGTTYAVAPDRTLYVSDSRSIYRSNGDGSYTSIYKTDDFVTIINASNDTLLFSQKKRDSNREGSIVLLHRNGDKYQVEGGVYNAAWSPSGQKFISSGDVAQVYDAQFKILTRLPDNNFLSPVWQDDSTVFYSLNNKVVSYNIDTGSAKTVASFDNVTGTPTQLSFSADKTFLYVAIQKGGERSSLAYRLVRIALKNVSPSIIPSQQLNLLIPNTVKGCALNYVNFIKFTITMKSSTTTNCEPAVQSYLNSYNIPPQGITYQNLR